MKAGNAILSVVFAALCISGGRAAEIDLTLDPDLKFKTEEKPDKKETFLVATLPLCADQGGGRMLELGFRLTGMWYYAPLRIGIKSADDSTEVGLHFEKSGGYANECRLYVRQSGKEKVIAKWDAAEWNANYRLILQWNNGGKIEFIAKDGINDVFKTACEAAAPLNADELFMRVVNNKDNGYIGYDCEEEGIFMRTQPGGGDYVASAFIDYISMKSLKQGDQK